VVPDSVRFEMMSRWRAALEKSHGRDVAHKTLRVWRTFWRVMQGMKVARTVDPSFGVRNLAPAPRWQRWSEGEAVRLVKSAWRQGYAGLGWAGLGWAGLHHRRGLGHWLLTRRCADPRCSPPCLDSGRLIFDRQVDGRAKTGRAAIGTVSARTERLVNAYVGELGLEMHPDAILFRNRSGGIYREATLAHDFATVRELAFPGDKRRLMDMRRSGAVEAIAGDAGPIGLAAKLANSIGRSNTIHKTYAPVELEAVKSTDQARLRGRQRMREANKSGGKVSPEQPGRVSPASARAVK
jgi:hypothetical protein